MLSQGFFLKLSSPVAYGHEDVYLDNDSIMFSPLDPIYVDDNENVFFSLENKNAYMFSDVDGRVFVRVVK